MLRGLVVGLADDPHVWGTALFGEVTKLGYGQSYVTFGRKIRDRGLRPLCAPCGGTGGRATVVLDHPAGWSVSGTGLRRPGFVGECFR